MTSTTELRRAVAKTKRNRISKADAHQRHLPAQKDAAWPSSTDQKLLDYEIEIEGREQRKGNIHKAVVTAFEPSLESLLCGLRRRPPWLCRSMANRANAAEGVSPSQGAHQFRSHQRRPGADGSGRNPGRARQQRARPLSHHLALARYVVLMPNNPVAVASRAASR